MGEIIKAHRVAKDFHLYKSWANFRLRLRFFHTWIFFSEILSVVFLPRCKKRMFYERY